MPEVLANQEVKDNEQKKEEKKPEIDETKLSANELHQIKEGKTTINQIAARRTQFKAEAEKELDGFVKEQKVVDLNEYKAFRKELEETESAEETEEILERIRDLPNQKEKQKDKEEDEKKSLSLDHPKIKEQLQSIERQLSDPDAIKWIGTKQEGPFKAWFREELRKEPSVKKAKELHEKLQNDRNGLRPRKEFFQRTLQPKLQKYGLSLDQCRYLREEGLTERQEALSDISAIEKILEGMRNTGLYSFKAKQRIVQEMLKADTQAKIKETAKDVRAVTRNESKQFTDQNSSIFTRKTVTVHGQKIRAMSQKSVELFLADYKDYDLETRSKTVLNWEKIIDNEGKLIEELGEIYKEDPDGFKTAIKTFELLTYQEKEQALKHNKRLVANNDKETVSESQQILRKSLTAIDKAREDKTLNATTAKDFREWAQDIDNYTDKKTHKVDLKEQENLYKKMTSDQPVYEKKNRNIAAYRERRKKFLAFHKKFAKDNPDISKQDIKDWQDEYDEGSYSERKKTYQKLKEEAAKKEKERLKKKVEEKEIGLTETEKREAEERSPGRTKLELSINKCLAENTKESIALGRKALRLYLISNPEEEDDKVLIYLEEQLAKAAREIGSQKETKKTKEQELDQAVKTVAESDQGIADRLEEEQIKHLNIDGTKLSEDRHQRTISAHERARKESMGRVQADSLEANLTEDAYKQMGETHILDKEGRGEEIKEVEFAEEEMDETDRQALKEKTYQEQAKIDTKEGFIHADLKDKAGRKISAEEAETLQDKDLEELEQEIAEKAGEKVSAKEEAETPGGVIYDLNAQIAARRKAKELIDKKKHEKLRAA